MLIPIENSKNIINQELSKRCQKCVKGSFTKFYLVYNESEEVAFAALDVNKDSESLVLYDLLVPSNICNKGNGTYALHEIESFASSQGFRKVILNPIPFNGDRTKEQLINWYKSRGYSILTNGDEGMEKIVNE